MSQQGRPVHTRSVCTGRSVEDEDSPLGYACKSCRGKDRHQLIYLKGAPTHRESKADCEVCKKLLGKAAPARKKWRHQYCEHCEDVFPEQGFYQKHDMLNTEKEKDGLTRCQRQRKRAEEKTKKKTKRKRTKKIDIPSIVEALSNDASKVHQLAQELAKPQNLELAVELRAAIATEMGISAAADDFGLKEEQEHLILDPSLKDLDHVIPLMKDFDSADLMNLLNSASDPKSVEAPPQKRTKLLDTEGDDDVDDEGSDRPQTRNFQSQREFEKNGHKLQCDQYDWKSKLNSKPLPSNQLPSNQLRRSRTI